MRTVINVSEAIEEKQLETLVYDRLVVSNLPILQKSPYQNKNMES